MAKTTKMKKEKETEKPKKEIKKIDEKIDATSKKHPVGRKEKYYEATGRRKSAIARVRLYTKIKTFIVNEKPINDYFSIERFQKEAISPLEKMKIMDKLGMSAKVKGGGIMAQSEAIKLGIARALINFNPIFKKRLRKLGLLTRDSRIVERKKYGLKKARRAPQWKKR